jgi:hypothetical protein
MNGRDENIKKIIAKHEKPTTVHEVMDWIPLALNTAQHRLLQTYQPLAAK